LKFYTNAVQIGNQILVRGYDNGRQFFHKEKYKPTMYLRSKVESEFKTLDGLNVRPVVYNNIYEAKQAIKKYADISNSKIYGFESFTYTYLFEEYREAILYDPSLIRIANIDIETVSDEGMPDIAEADKGITAITVKCSGKIVAFGLREFETTDPEVTYIQCDDEEELLLKFLDTIEYFSPDCFTGWNIVGFDIPYIVNRIVRLFDVEQAKRLSPWNLLQEKRTFDRGVMREYYYPVGVSILDYMLIYKKLIFEPRESYRLDAIGFAELGERKLDYSEYENLASLYRENHQMFMEYNIKDVRLVDRLEDKLRLIELIFSMAYEAKCNFEDMLGSVKPWEIKSYGELMAQNIVFPPKLKKDSLFEKESLEGGFVKEPIIGMHDWVVSFDLNSLYPHLIMQYNISPETFVGKREESCSLESILNGDVDDEIEHIRENNYIVSANGCFYRRDIEGFFPKMMEKLYNGRVENKNKMLEAKRQLEKTKDKDEIARLNKEISRQHNAQLNKKILLNSAYGVLTNEHFRFYSFDNAEAITKGGQLSVRWVEKALNIYMNQIMKTKGVDYIIYADTDSVYVNFGPLVKSLFDEDTPKEEIINFIDTSVKEKFQKTINTAYETLRLRMNADKQKMIMKRESIAERGIWTGKKRYILNVWDKEDVRYKEPKINITGLESVRSSTPSSCREKIKQISKLIMNTDEETVLTFIEDFRKEFETLPFDEIASPRGINGMKKYDDPDMIFKDRTPIQVRGALVFNKALKDFGVNNISPIFDGDKIKYCYLQMPNTVKSNVISISSILPKEFKLDDKLDRDTQFDKCFLEPVKNILMAIGWKHERDGVSLESFFS
jgi:DNA polymerase elongation subunit (family B)